MYCKYCGKQNLETSKFCKYCGKRINTARKELQGNNETSYDLGAWGLVFVIILFIIGFLYFFNSNSASSENTDSYNSDSNTTSTNDSNNSYGEAYKRNFINSCISKGDGSSSLDAFCSCAADYLVANYNSTELTRFDSEYTSTGELPEEISEAAGACESYL